MIPVAYDMHIHSCLSPCGDDDMTPGNIVGMATIMGLKALALTDHNTCKNCPAFLNIAKQYGIIAIPGMELTTSEEVHVLCYFSNLSDALDFDRFIEDKILPIPNNPKFFGNQIITDENDEQTGIFDTLLISATSVSFDDIPALMEKYNGIMVPAHLDKSSTSLLSNLGMIPEGSTFKIAELKNLQRLDELKALHPYLEKCRFLSSSDAHSLNALQEPVRFIHVEEESSQGLFDALLKMNRSE